MTTNKVFSNAEPPSSHHLSDVTPGDMLPAPIDQHEVDVDKAVEPKKLEQTPQPSTDDSKSKAAMVVNRPPIADVKETVGAPVVARPRSPATGINAQPESQPHSEGAYVYRDQLIPTAGPENGSGNGSGAECDTESGESDGSGTESDRSGAVSDGSGTVSDGSGIEGNDAGNEAPTRHCRWKFILIILLIISLFAAILCSITMAVYQTFKQQRHSWVPNGKMELLPNDTILAYRGRSLSLQFTAKNLSNSAAAFAVHLYSVDCNGLTLHDNLSHVPNSPLIFSSYYPTPRPFYYQHYELESVLNYTLLQLAGLANATLELFVFNNETIENQYINDPFDPALQSKAVYRSHLTNESRQAIYEPSVAGNYIVTFVAKRGTRAYIKYTVKQTYYSLNGSADYYKCELSPSSPSCIIHSNHTDMCVLASSGINHPSTLVTHSYKITENENLTHHKIIFFISLAFLLFFGMIFITLLLPYIYINRHLCSKYSELP